MPTPAFALVQVRAEQAAIRRLCNARMLAGATVFDCLLTQEVHPMGLVGEMGELRTVAKAVLSDAPALARDDLVQYDPATYSAAELLTKDPAQFRVDAVEPYGAACIKVWLR